MLIKSWQLTWKHTRLPASTYHSAKLQRPRLLIYRVQMLKCLHVSEKEGKYPWASVVLFAHESQRPHEQLFEGAALRAFREMEPAVQTHTHSTPTWCRFPRTSFTCLKAAYSFITAKKGSAFSLLVLIETILLHFLIADSFWLSQTLNHSDMESETLLSGKEIAFGPSNIGRCYVSV